MSKYMYLLDKQTGKQYEIPEKETVVLGRSRETDIQVSKEEKHKEITKKVSRRHCRLIRQDLLENLVDPEKERETFASSLGVVDLESMNGTYVNESRVREEPVILNSGDILSLGSSYENSIIAKLIYYLSFVILKHTTDSYSWSKATL